MSSNKCKYCGRDDFKSKGELLQHYRSKECQQEEKAADEPREIVLPLSVCPDELKYMRKGQMVPLKVLGVFVEGGVKVRRSDVSLLR
ncbi:MAG: hypothetical protein PHW65_05565 [Dehalococcoidales bacterium]|nr:hypothetical protein [Dehalococcoidales bacterium]